MGAICGDGRCDSGLGEKADNCAYDCGTGKGCCAVRNASAANSNIFTNCALYSVTATTTNFGSTPCSFQPACLSSYSSYPAYYGICGKNPDYPCNTYSISTSECSNHSTICMVSGTSCVKKQDCADLTDASSCNGNSSCVWVGQPDSPYCYGYCNTPVTSPAPPDIPYYTYQTCQTNTNNWLSGYYSQYGGVDSNICGISKRDVTNVSTDPNYCKTHNCFESNRGTCATGSAYQETARNCPLNCSTIDSVTGKANATSDGCGDGVCDSTEQKGGTNYCYTDCGDIGDGNCLAFSGICPKFNYNKAGCDATYVCSYSSSNNLCAINAAFGPALPSDSTCAKAKGRTDCNRIGCYWNVLKTQTCGNGVIDSGETEITCPVDFYSKNNRGKYCQGTVACAGIKNEDSCRTAGCQWVKAGAYTE